MITFSVLYNIIALFAFIFGVFYIYFKYSFTHWKKLGVPTLEPKFPFGTFQESISAIKPLGDDLKTQYNIFKTKGQKFMGAYFFHNPVFVPLCPELCKAIMAKDFAYFVDRGVYHDEENDPLTAHLFSLNGQKWKNLRAKLTPTFTSGKMKKMFQTLVDCSLELKDCLNDPISRDEPVDIKKILVQYTTDVIGSCAFGIECNTFKNPDSEFSQLGHKIFAPAGLDRIKLFFAFAFPSIAKLLKLKIVNRDVDYFFRKLVKDTIEYRESNNITRNDFMHLLIQLKNNGIIDDEDNEEEKLQHDIGTALSINEIAAQAFLFFAAGFETSSTAMTFCLFEMAQHQNVQDKVREEIVKVLKKYDGKITYESLQEMRYMEQTIQESMRIHPPLMVLQREATKDYEVPDTNIVLKKGTVVMIPIFAIHMDPEYYPNPTRFDPDRFTEENKANRSDYAWLPFGEGPRVCIGLRFGMMQIKVGLCQLLLNYKFTLNSKTKLPITLDPNSFVSSAVDKIYLNAERVTKI